MGANKKHDCFTILRQIIHEENSNDTMLKCDGKRRGDYYSPPGKTAAQILTRLGLILIVLWLPCLTNGNSLGPNDDPYKILGVERGANTAEIKSAYRQKARDTHPDKNPGQDPEEAALSFRRVVDAFEILSDESSRRNYDRTGKTDGGGGFNANSGDGGGAQYRRQGNTWTFTFQSGGRRAPRRLKDEPKVRDAQSRVMHVVSLSQLETIITNDEGLTERSLLMCFVTPGEVERMAEDVIVFPYPFAGFSVQNIWWEVLLQTAQIKFNRGTELSKYFNVPHGDDLSAPYFVFVEKGRPLNEFTSFSSSNREAFENWVWDQLNVSVVFVNKHSHPVELYWIHGRRAKILTTLKPGEERRERTMLTHEFYARDDRVDRWKNSPGRHKLSTNSAIGSWKILSDPISEEHGNTIYIETSCFDMSGHCEWWRARDECSKNPNFMRDTCPKSCNLCPSLETNETTDSDNNIDNEEQQQQGNNGDGSKTRDEL